MASFIKYPRGRLFAVIDDPAAGARAVDALVRAGIEEGRVELLRGDTAADAFDATGKRHGLLGRARRAIEFTWMDQMPDLAWYEAAIRGGRSIVSVRARDHAEVRTAAHLLTGLGAHFINYFGRFVTESIEPWHGPEPAVPGYLTR